jgi:hypothetical protein
MDDVVAAALGAVVAAALDAGDAPGDDTVVVVVVDEELLFPPEHAAAATTINPAVSRTGTVLCMPCSFHENRLWLTTTLSQCKHPLRLTAVLVLRLHLT